MRILVIGLGVQGIKRVKVAGSDVSATVDPQNPSADFKLIDDVPLNAYDAAIVCTPDLEKLRIIRYLLVNDKHVLVEKPLWAGSKFDLKGLAALLTEKSNLVLKTAYNHRFEPNFIEMKNLIQSGELGKLYSCRMFYGNGTAELVRNSEWRDRGAGVLSDLGSHLLDTCFFWFESNDFNFKTLASNNYENLAPDHVIISSESPLPRIELEMTLCMWRNHFTCDIIGSEGSAHIESLCKWGPSKFTHRRRVFPAGKPLETEIVQSMDDPTWKLEYENFRTSIEVGKKDTLDKDIWLYDTLKELEKFIVV